MAAVVSKHAGKVPFMASKESNTKQVGFIYRLVNRPDTVSGTCTGWGLGATWSTLL